MSDASVRAEIKTISATLAHGDGEIARLNCQLDDLTASKTSRQRRVAATHLAAQEIAQYNETLAALEAR